jgi:hypothetical protein
MRPVAGHTTALFWRVVDTGIMVVGEGTPEIGVALEADVVPPSIGGRGLVLTEGHVTLAAAHDLVIDRMPEGLVELAANHLMTGEAILDFPLLEQPRPLCPVYLVTGATGDTVIRVGIPLPHALLVIDLVAGDTDQPDDLRIGLRRIGHGELFGVFLEVAGVPRVTIDAGHGSFGISRVFVQYLMRRREESLLPLPVTGDAEFALTRQIAGGG